MSRNYNLCVLLDESDLELLRAKSRAADLPQTIFVRQLIRHADIPGISKKRRIRKEADSPPRRRKAGVDRVA